jgi:leucine dehydrogenase
MSVFSHSEYDQHQTVAFHHDPATGLKAIIAVHNTHLGAGLGGCRMFPYASDEQALRDVLRLSKGMTYKAALAGLPQGGGKSVIIGNPHTDKTPALMRAMGRFVDSLGGQYIAAEDSGTSVADIHEMHQVTAHVGGLADAAAQAAGRTGDPSPGTAYGTFVGLKAAVRHRLGRENVAGLKVAIQGVGNVGFRLAEYLVKEGALIYVTDTHQPSLERAAALGATVVSPEAIFALDVDVFAPCAMGAILNDQSIPQLKAKVIAGAANNQLAESRHGWRLLDRGILYAPDCVINAGGIIEIHHETVGYDLAKATAHLDRIGETLWQIFERSAQTQRPTHEIADEMAEAVFRIFRG